MPTWQKVLPIFSFVLMLVQSVRKGRVGENCIYIVLVILKKKMVHLYEKRQERNSRYHIFIRGTNLTDTFWLEVRF